MDQRSQPSPGQASLGNAFHLGPGSPAQGSGDATHAPSTDYDGVTRTSPVDIGAF
ncbi:MAG: choice-of-anchor Q domain-containing protein [Myxococcales bacterium]